MNTDYMDEDGYPTEEAVNKIAKWPYAGNLNEVFEFIHSLWQYDDYINSEKKEDGSTEWKISTGGWSGNETLITALQENRMIMALTWVQSRRGGHYIFEVPARKGEKTQ